jgi:hypothetical protein
MMNIKQWVLNLLFINALTPAIAQMPSLPGGSKITPGLIASMLGDSSKKGGPAKAPKPFKDFITPSTQTDEGLFHVYKQDDKYFMSIPNNLLGRDILIVSRVSKSSAATSKDFYGYAGDQINNNVIRFEKGPNHKIFIKSIYYREVSKDSTQEMFKAIQNNTIQPIAAAFDVKFLGKDSASSIIEFTDYINGDNEVMHFGPGTKSIFGINAMPGTPQADKSYIQSVKSYPANVEFKSVKTYSKAAPQLPAGFPSSFSLGGGNYGNITLEVNTSMIILPEKPMRHRDYDPRIGYFARGFKSFDANPQGVKDITMVTRWRLEPKEEDIEKYKKGELVDPKKPIVFYIDPSTPEKWIPYLIQGVNDWQVAFEKAGFKNAIFGKRAPTKAEDSTWSLEDARNSAIIYKPSEVENAYGPNVNDPRSGEIIESHIGWFHNIQKLLRDWFMIQTAAVEPDARKLVFDDKLMGELIRFVSSHEVGHTLGLQHNFGSSNTTPVEKLRDKAWVEANGHTPSIMDYARFNYVAQPEDKVAKSGLFPRIGDYDKWAIEWGYKYFPEAKGSDEEKLALSKLTTGKLKDNRLWYGRQGNDDDPRSQSEDIGDNSMKASTYGIKNLQYIIKNLASWTKVDGEGYRELGDAYQELIGQFSRYMGHVTKHIGGIEETPKTADQPGAVYALTTKADQKEALAFLDKQLFTTPKWLLEKDIITKVGLNPATIILNRQEAVINRIVNYNTLYKMSSDAEVWGAKDMFTSLELLDDMKRMIFKEVTAKTTVDLYRRNLQRAYVERLAGLINPQPTGGITFSFGAPTAGNSEAKRSDVMSILKAHARSLRTELLTAGGDRLTKAHTADLADRLAKALDPK